MNLEIQEKEMLLEVLKRHFPDSSRRTLQSWVKHGRFVLDGKVIQRENVHVTVGQKLEVRKAYKGPKALDFEVLYADRHCIVINKPVGLLSVPLDDERENRHALGLLKDHFQTAHIFAVHRIDRETSGVLLFARGKESAQHFDRLFEAHDIKREYLAVVEGHLAQKSGIWQCKLRELPSYSVIESFDGKIATTHFEVLKRSKKYSYLRLQLETGRKHQIRVHCQRAGHPVIGDRRYGSTENPLKRLGLHAALLSFIHPFTQQEVAFVAPLPKAFAPLFHIDTLPLASMQ